MSFASSFFFLSSCHLHAQNACCPEALQKWQLSELTILEMDFDTIYSIFTILLFLDTFTCRKINHGWLWTEQLYNSMLLYYSVSMPLGLLYQPEQHKLRKIQCTFNRSHIEFCTLLNMHMDMFFLRPACWKSTKYICCHIKVCWITCRISICK